MSNVPNNYYMGNGVSDWFTTPSTTTINTGNFKTYYPIQSAESLHFNVGAVEHKELDYINTILDEYFEEYNVDVENVTMKELFDYIVKKDARLIQFVPQTVDRCKLALSTEWSRKVKDAIKLPFTGELHKFYLKMKLTNGSLK